MYVSATAEEAEAAVRDYCSLGKHNSAFETESEREEHDVDSSLGIEKPKAPPMVSRDASDDDDEDDDEVDDEDGENVEDLSNGQLNFSSSTIDGDLEEALATALEPEQEQPPQVGEIMLTSKIIANKNSITSVASIQGGHDLYFKL